MKKVMTRTNAGLRVLTPFLALTLLLACDSEDNAEPSQVPVIGDEDDAGSTEPTDEGESSDDTEDTDDTGQTEETDEPTDNTDQTDEPTDDTGPTEETDEPTDDTGEPTDATDDSSATDDTSDTGETDDSSQTEETDEPTDDTASTDTVSSTDDPDGGGPVVVPEECVENADTCVSCPTEAEDFAIQCSDSECAPFDNVARLGRFVEGAPLEEVP